MVKVLGVETDDFEKSSVQEILNYFNNKKYVQYDSETTGFDAYNTELVCFQVGNYENQFVIHPSYLSYFKDLLESKTLLGVNLKFDLRFLYHQDIYPNSVWDTFLAESVLYCGDVTHKKGLAPVAKARLGIDLDKSVRDQIWKEGLTKRVIEYSATDVKWLEKIKENQDDELNRKDLQVALKIENNYVLVLAYIEYCGFKLNKEKWQKKCDNDIISLKQAKQNIDNFIIENKHNKHIEFQGDLFCSDIKTKINWDSPKQVIEYFKELGIPVEYEEKGELKESVGAKIIAKFEKKFPIVKEYLEYKEKQTVCSRYGENFIHQINKSSGRLHSNFRQIMDTARISSGGKDKNTGEEYINFQNIPAGEETRSCFIAEEGNVLIDADFSGQEQVVLANKSLDPNLLIFYDNDLGDIHSFTAKNMYNELKDIDLKEIKEKFKDKRQAAKSAGFAINYGGNANTIANNENIPLEDAQNIYDQYFQAFPGLGPYFEKMKQQGLKNGYILFNEVTRRKSYIFHYYEYLELKKQIDRDFWNKWKILKQEEEERQQKDKNKTGIPSQEYLHHRKKFKRFFEIQGEIQRKSLNFPIQGTSAEITKISAILIFKWIKEQKLLKIVKFVNQVHDENILESPKDLAEKVARKVEECMKQAGEIYCKRVPLKADASISDHWVH